MRYVSIHYNRPDFVGLQHKCITRLGGELVVVNNSNDKEIERECKRLGIKCCNLIGTGDPSQAHGEGINWAIRSGLLNEGGLLLDHDTFPVREPQFDDVIGVKLEAKRSHLLPSYLGFKAHLSDQMREIDFRPVIGGDTGFGTYYLLSKYDVKLLESEAMRKLIEGTAQNTAVIDRYKEGDKTVAIHAICGSNWTGHSPIKEKDILIHQELSRYL